MAAATLTDLHTALTNASSWRRIDLASIKSLVEANSGKAVYLRMLIPMIYAHWEGYAKIAFREYYAYLKLRRIDRNDINADMFKLFIEKYLSFDDKSDASSKIIQQLCGPGNLQWPKEDAISTRSNLNYEVLVDLCSKLGLPHDVFETKKAFIDISLLERRNSIAHGQHIAINAPIVISAIKDVGELISTLENLIIDSARDYLYYNEQKKKSLILASTSI